uniref:Uncharacterized protein n=1 Tax=Anguilla anguilla TaxID=7936 RepID=A0A0E9RUT4_ANGAN
MQPGRLLNTWTTLREKKSNVCNGIYLLLISIYVPLFY